MFAKRAHAATSGAARIYRKELEYLYARRTAVDALIESLQQYDRFRIKPTAPAFKRKSA